MQIELWFMYTEFTIYNFSSLTSLRSLSFKTTGLQFLRRKAESHLLHAFHTHTHGSAGQLKNDLCSSTYDFIHSANWIAFFFQFACRYEWLSCASVLQEEPPFSILVLSFICLINNHLVSVTARCDDMLVCLVGLCFILRLHIVQKP